jgi:hypothetical protein
MIHTHTARALASMAVLATLAIGCSTLRTRVTEQWKDPSYAAGTARNVVVLAENAPISTTRHIEEEFVDELEDEGIVAVTAHEVFGGNVPDVGMASPILKSKGYDAALVVTVERAEEVTMVVPQENFFSVPLGSSVQIYSHPRLGTQYTLHVNTTLWDLRGNKRVWRSNARVENARYGSFASRLSKEVVDEVAKQGLITKSK